MIRERLDERFTALSSVDLPMRSGSLLVPNASPFTPESSVFTKGSCFAQDLRNHVAERGLLGTGTSRGVRVLSRRFPPHGRFGADHRPRRGVPRLRDRWRLVARRAAVDRRSGAPPAPRQQPDRGPCNLSHIVSTLHAPRPDLPLGGHIEESLFRDDANTHHVNRCAIRMILESFIQHCCSGV